jgi:hypothetical protein
MRTVPRNWPRRMPRGDYIVRCYYCRSPVPKSLARVDGDGRYCCRAEPGGMTSRELDLANAAAARSHVP